MKFIFNPFSGAPTPVPNKAAEITYDNTSSGLTATETQAALDEIEGIASAAQTTANAAIPASEKGANNGVATLDAGGKIPVGQLPNSVMEYLGTWAASTNTPTLTNGTGNAGDVYIASDAGTVNFGAGPITFAAGDWVVYSGAVWQKSVNSNSVVSVNGQSGVVTLDTDDITEGTSLYFTDERAQDAVGGIVATSAKVSLTYNDGTPNIIGDIVAGSLVNADISASAAIEYTKLDLVGDIVNADINASAAIERTKLANGTANRVVVNNGSGQLSDAAAITASRALASDTNGIPVASATTATELGFVSGVTGAIQTQLNGKEPTITQLPISQGGTNSVTALNNNRIMQSNGGAIVEAAAIAASRALQSNSNGIPVASSVTDVELGYLSGAESSVQSQIDQSSLVKGDNRNFETTVGDWLAYANAASSQPSTGTGGSPVVTFTRTTSSPLNGVASGLLTKDAANRRGQGGSVLLDVPVAYRGKPLKLSFPYGASVNFSFASQASDVRVYFYDVTNSQLLEPNSPFLDGSGFYTGSVQLATNCAQVRVILHVATVNAAAWTLEVDDVQLQLNENEFVNSQSNWAAYTPTFTGFGTVTVQNFEFRVNGANLEVRGRYTCGTTTAVEARVSLPPGYISSSTLPIVQVAGVCQTNNFAATYFGESVLIEPSVSYFTFGRQISTISALTKQLGSDWLSSGNIVSFSASVPCIGLTSGTAHPAAIGLNAQVVFLGTQATQAVTADVTNITLTAAKDTTSSWSTNLYNVRSPGDYIVNGSFTTSAVSTIQVYRNGVLVNAGAAFATVDTANRVAAGSILVRDCVYGDTISLRSTTSVTVTNGYISIYKLGSEVQPYAPRIAYLKDQKAATTDGGTFTSGAFRTRDLNTLTGDSSFITVASNQFTLQPGTYHVEWSVPAFNVGYHQSRLRNITDSTSPIIGSSAWAANTDNVANESFGEGVVSISAARVFEVQHLCSVTRATDGFGVSDASMTEAAIYTQVKITKVL